MGGGVDGVDLSPLATTLEVFRRSFRGSPIEARFPSPPDD
jgi:hypothetical protein